MVQQSIADIYRIAPGGERVRFAVSTGSDDLATLESFYNSQTRGHFRFVAQRREA